MDKTQITECQKCGTCCTKGGPSFHIEDVELIEKGVIPAKYIYTIRQGEPARDNVKDTIIFADSDIIKIKGVNNTATCIYYNAREKSCNIYDNRPVECRALKCWDTLEIEEIYSKDRLTRKDLLSDIDGLWDLVQEHHNRCSYHRIQIMARALDEENEKSILELIRYDTSVRNLAVEKAGIDLEMTDFLFGKPLTETIKRLGLEIEKKGDSYRLIMKFERSCRI